MTRGIDAVVVAIPAHDEQAYIDGCLDATAAAAGQLHRHRPGIPVVTVVAADACRDATAASAQRREVDVVHLEVHSVGLARDAAIQAAVARLGSQHQSILICTTDADTHVPVSWLEVNVELADCGADVILGTVEPVGLPAHLLTAWHDRHDLAEDHPHIHGANIALTLTAWTLLGGFGDRPVDEDVELAARARAAGLNIVATDRHRAATSGRDNNRVTGGFAGYLRRMWHPVTPAHASDHPVPTPKPHP